MHRVSKARVARELAATMAIAAIATPAFAEVNSFDQLTAGSIQVAAADTAPVQVAAADTMTAQNAPEVERVLITARRREEDAQDVPVSASVVTGVTLDK